MTQSIMLSMALPFVNILSKCDLIDKKDLKILKKQPEFLLTKLNFENDYKNLNEAIINVLNEFNMVNFIPLNLRDEESIKKIT